MFGEIVVMVVQGPFTEADLSNIREQIEATLPMYWQPKRYVVIDKIPIPAISALLAVAVYRANALLTPTYLWK